MRVLILAFEHQLLESATHCSFILKIDHSEIQTLEQIQSGEYH